MDGTLPPPLWSEGRRTVLVAVLFEHGAHPLHCLWKLLGRFVMITPAHKELEGPEMPSTRHIPGADWT